MNSKAAIAALLAAVLAAVGVTIYAVGRPHPHPRPQPSPSPSAIPSASPGSCHMRAAPESGALLVLPDPVCTPGVANPAVSQATMGSTICRVGWTKTVRPPLAYTQQLKARGMVAYGFTDAVGRHEEDHLIALELGGSPRDPRNLWPEPGATPNAKDQVENYLHDQVCKHGLQLTTAQQEIARDWYAVWVQMGRPAPSPVPGS